ncbi:MAG: LysR family transcriptional regulator, partial [Porticoccaceae bacterium]|nr:LysR family transcriptional regulator [Porticoccaceae bacterium]
TLQRLRILFDDELFVRSGRELVPTPRALELQAHLPEVLGDLEALVMPREFDPQTDSGTIYLATPEFIAVQIVPMLAWELSAEAPGFSLSVSSNMENFPEQMRNGELDFVLGVDKKMSKEYLVTPVGGFSPAIWMRHGHPLASEELTLEKVLEYPFIQYFLLLTPEKLSPAVETRFDKTIAKMGLKRTKALVTDQLMTALNALQTSDCLMLSTVDDLKAEAEFYEIVRKPYPPELEADDFIPVVLFQHRTTQKSPIHDWFKKRLMDVVERVRTSY